MVLFYHFMCNNTIMSYENHLQCLALRFNSKRRQRLHLMIKNNIRINLLKC